MQALKPIALLLSAFVISGCETLREVDKALYTVSDELAPRDRVTGERTLNFKDRQKQIEIGNARAEQYLQAKYRSKNLKLNSDLDVETYGRLKRIFNKVLSVSHFSGEEWSVFLVPDDSFNAKVFGGTYVVVHIGLMKELSDDEIASVLGHELAHVAAGHIWERDAHLKTMGIAGKKSISQDGYVASFTAVNEQEADRIGVLYAALAGYDPNAASRIWSRMARSNAYQWSYYRSHPADDERASQTQAYAAKAEDYFTPGKINVDHAKLLSCNSLWCTKNRSSTGGGDGSGLLSVLESTLKAISDNERAKAERARQQSKMLKQQLAQRYGIKPPAQNSSGYASRSSVIAVKRVYKSTWTYPRKRVRGTVKTMFFQDRSNNLVGEFQVSARGKRLGGLLWLEKQISDRKFLFKFQGKGDDDVGDLLVEFSRSGRFFKGRWREASGSGEWDGRY